MFGATFARPRDDRLRPLCDLDGSDYYLPPGMRPNARSLQAMPQLLANDDRVVAGVPPLRVSCLRQPATARCWSTLLLDSASQWAARSTDAQMCEGVDRILAAARYAGLHLQATTGEELLDWVIGRSAPHACIACPCGCSERRTEHHQEQRAQRREQRDATERGPRDHLWSPFDRLEFATYSNSSGPADRMRHSYTAHGFRGVVVLAALDEACVPQAFGPGTMTGWDPVRMCCRLEELATEEGRALQRIGDPFWARVRCANPPTYCPGKPSAKAPAQALYVAWRTQQSLSRAFREGALCKGCPECPHLRARRPAEGHVADPRGASPVRVGASPPPRE